MLHDEVVTRRQWVTEEYFLDLLGATNLIPGPNSTEMFIHIGRVRAGWRGLIVSGVCFIMPAAAIVLVLAWAYVRFGSTPAAEWLLYGIKPVIIAIILQALWNLGRTAIKGPLLLLIAVAVVGLYLLGVNELVLLFGGGLVVMLVRNRQRLRPANAAPLAALLPLLSLPLTIAASAWLYPAFGRLVSLYTAAVETGRCPVSLSAALVETARCLVSMPHLASAASRGGIFSSWLQAVAGTPVTLQLLFLVFLKIGSVLYGSGYVLLAFLRGDLVVRLGWLTDKQLLDAVAVGQFTPGPVFTTATFIGYILGGLPGAVLATVGIFLPSFIFVAAVNPLLPRLRRSPWLGALLDGVNVAALGLMAAVTWDLGRAALVDWVTLALAALALVLLMRYKANSAWLVLGGGIFALLWRWLAL